MLKFWIVAISILFTIEARKNNNNPSSLSSSTTTNSHKVYDLGMPQETPLNLETLEQMAHGTDDGATILASDGQQLIQLYFDKTAPDENRETAGKILGTALRNNDMAGDVVVSKFADFPSELVRDFSPRSIQILANLATTQSKQISNALSKLRTRMASASTAPAVAAKIVKLIRDVAPADPTAIATWADALQNALASQDLSDETRHIFLQQLADIVSKAPPFEAGSMQIQPEFLKWLSDQATRPAEQAKRDDETGRYLQFVKKVRHKTFGNPKAARSHFDEL